MATYQGHNEDSSGNILLPLANGMVAKVETGTTASQAYTKGTYFSANNRFCKAKTAIASGDTLTSGTNYTATSVGAEMKSHLQLSDGSKEFYFDYQNSKYGWNEKADRSGTFHPFGGTISKYCLISMYWASTSFIRVYKNSSETISAQPSSTWTGTWNESDLLSLKVTDLTSPVVITFKQNCKVFGGNCIINTSTNNSLTGSYSSGQTLNIRPDNNYYTILFAYLD